MAQVVRGSEIKKYILENGIKQNFIAEQTKISAPVLNLILNDKRRIEVNEYIKICNAINVPFVYFIKK